MKKLTYIVIILASFIAGYYSSYFSVQDQLKEIKDVGKTIIGNIKESDIRWKTEKNNKTLYIESEKLKTLVWLQKSGNSISAAIKESCSLLKTALNKSKSSIKNIKKPEEKLKAENKIKEIETQLENARFYY